MNPGCPAEATGGVKTQNEPKDVTPDKEVVALCRIGERSSHSPFVRKCLLGDSVARDDDISGTDGGPRNKPNARRRRSTGNRAAQMGMGRWVDLSVPWPAT